jgi:hypothetical protein
MSKLFDDMNVIERKNKFDQRILRSSINQMRKKELIDGKAPNEIFPDKEDVTAEVSKVVSLIKKIVIGQKIFLEAVGDLGFNTQINIAVNTQEQYSKLRSLLTDLVENKIFSLTSKQITSIVNEFSKLALLSKNRLDPLVMDLSNADVDQLSSDEIVEMNNILDMQDSFHDVLDLVSAIESRLDVIGRGISKVPFKFR